jgi:hypothetical protein
MAQELVILVDTGSAEDDGLADLNADWILSKEKRKAEVAASLEAVNALRKGAKLPPQVASKD